MIFLVLPLFKNFKTILKIIFPHLFLLFTFKILYQNSKHKNIKKFPLIFFKIFFFF